MFHNLPNIDTEGLLVTHHPNGITEIVLRDLRRPTVDLFITAMNDHDRVCLQNNRHAFRLIRPLMSHTTPYLTARMIAGARQNPPNHRESDAIVAPDTRVILLIRSVLAKLEKTVNRSIRVCITDQEAYAWLEQRRQLLGD
jgi:hypothetical protein